MTAAEFGYDRRRAAANGDRSCRTSDRADALHARQRSISSVVDAIGYLREQEPRPGVDVRDEVLHRLERARTDEELQQAAEAFLQWAEELELLLAPPETARR